MNTQRTVTRQELSSAITLAFAALPGMRVLNRKRYGLNQDDASNDEAVTFRTLLMSNWYQAWESLDLLWRDATPDVRRVAIAMGQMRTKMPKEILDESLRVPPAIEHELWDVQMFKQLASGEAPAIPRKGSPS